MWGKRPLALLMVALAVLPLTFGLALAPKPAFAASSTVGDVLGPVASPNPITDPAASSYAGYSKIGCMVAAAVDKGAEFKSIAAIERFVLTLWPSQASMTAQACKTAVDNKQAQADLSGATDYSVVGTDIAQVADWTIYTGGCGLPGLGYSPGDGYTSTSNPCAVASVPAGTNADQMPAVRFPAQYQQGSYWAPNDWAAGWVSASGSDVAQSVAEEWLGATGANSIHVAGSSPQKVNVQNVGTAGSSASSTWNGCGGNFGNICANGVAAGSEWDSIETFYDSAGTQFCTVHTVGGTSPTTCNTVAPMQVALGGEYPSDANCGAASCVHTSQRWTMDMLSTAQFGRLACLRNATTCDTVTDHTNAQPSNAPPTVPTSQINCVLQVNVTVPGAYGSGATCPTGAGTTIVINPGPPPAPQTGQATEGTLQGVLGQLIHLPDAIWNLAVQAGSRAPAWADYWRVWFQERMDTLIQRVTDLATKIGAAVVQPIRDGVEGCWLSDRVAESCTALDLQAVYGPAQAWEQANGPPFPIGIPQDLHDAAVAFDVPAQAPTIDWNIVSVSKGLAGVGGWDLSIHIYGTPDKFCLDQTNAACVMLFGFEVWNGITVIALIRMAELIIWWVLLTRWLAPKTVVRTD